MSGVTIGAAVIGAAATVAGTVSSIHSSKRQAKAARSAARAQAEQSNKQLAQQKEQYNRANQKQADIGSLLEANTGSDIGTTMLSGAQGIDPNQLQLQKGGTLLGG